MQKTFADCNFLIEKLKGGIEIKKRIVLYLSFYVFGHLSIHLCILMVWNFLSQKGSEKLFIFLSSYNIIVPLSRRKISKRKLRKGFTHEVKRAAVDARNIFDEIQLNFWRLGQFMVTLFGAELHNSALNYSAILFRFKFSSFIQLWVQQFLYSTEFSNFIQFWIQQFNSALNSAI